MRMNVPAPSVPVKTHEGGCAARLRPIEQLRRSVMACMPWEKGFYEDGVEVAERIKRLVQECDPADVSRLAIDTREKGQLRHVPLLLARELLRHPRADRRMREDTIARCVQRADELGELMALYAADAERKPGREGKVPTLPVALKLGLARALRKFDEYRLAKYANRPAAFRPRDVLFLTHAKPENEAQAALWKRLADDELKAPDTWEAALSAGADKRATFERLIREGKLGYMALLRNLRNMEQAGCDIALICNALLSGAEKSRALPFRFVAASRAAPWAEPTLDAAMIAVMGRLPRMPGRTGVLVDVSGSMEGKLSAKSDLTRLDAASALAALVVGTAEEARVFSFSDALAEVPPRRGMALIDAIDKSQRHNGTYLAGASAKLWEVTRGKLDRMIVITDEQSHDGAAVGEWPARYLINVATNKNGVNYGAGWTHINGFSESIVSWIAATESGGWSENSANAED